MRRAASKAAVVLAALAAVTAATAARPASAQATEDAKQSFQNGVALYNEGDYQGALAEFLSAYEAKPHHSVLYNIAQCYQMIEANQKAIAYYEQFLDEGSDYIKETKKQQVLKEIEKLKALLTPATIKVSQDGAEVLVDGKSMGKTPLEGVLYLDPGEHMLTVEKAGFEPHKQEFVAKRGDAITFEVTLVAVVTVGTISVKSQVDGATGAVDGIDLGVLPAETIVEAGEHEVVVSAPGHLDAKKKVVVEKAGKVAVMLDPMPAPVEVPGAGAGAGAGAGEGKDKGLGKVEKKKSKKTKELTKGAIVSGVLGALALAGAGSAITWGINEKNNLMRLRQDIQAGVVEASAVEGKYESIQESGRAWNAVFMVFVGVAIVDLVAMAVLAPMAAKSAKADKAAGVAGTGEAGGTGEGGGTGEAGEADGTDGVEETELPDGPEGKGVSVMPALGGAVVTVTF